MKIEILLFFFFSTTLFSGSIISLHEKKNNDDSINPVCLAVGKNHTQTLKKLLEKGHSANPELQGGTTPLHIAIFGNNAENTQLLLDHGALIHKKDSFKRNPFDHALFNLKFQHLFPLLLTPQQPTKSPKKNKLSYQRIITFLCCCKKIDFPTDLQFYLLSFMPEEIYCPAMLNKLLEKRSSDFSCYLPYCPQRWITSAIKNTKTELQEQFKKQLKSYILNHATVLCQTKIEKDIIGAHLEPYHILDQHVQVSEAHEIKKYFDPENATERIKLIDDHLKKLLKENNEKI